MKRVFDNAVILEGDELTPLHGYVVVEEGIITEVSEGAYLGGDKEDVKRGIIVPSFTNAHVHLGDAGGQDLGAYLPIGERVGRNGLKYRIHRQPDSLEAIKDALKFMKQSGTGAFCDFREGGVDGVKELEPLIDVPSRILGRPLGDENIFEHCDGFGISSVKDYTPEILDRLLIHREGKLVGVHCSEVRDDVKEVLGIEPDFLVHLTTAGEKSLKKVFSKKIPIVLCPRANASFGVGLPDLKSILTGPCPVAIGTDNVMANSPDMFREMEFLWKLYRGLYKDPEFNAKTVLKMATINGRRVLGLPDNTIKEGNPASFIVVKPKRFATDPVLSLVHRTSPADIKKIVV